MAPLPKKKHSRARKGGRNAHNALSAPAVGNCSACGAIKLPHRACRECGFYHGRYTGGIAEPVAAGGVAESSNLEAEEAEDEPRS